MFLHQNVNLNKVFLLTKVDGRQTPSVFDLLTNSVARLFCFKVLSFCHRHLSPQFNASCRVWWLQVRWHEASGWTGLPHWALMFPECADVWLVKRQAWHGSMLAEVWVCTLTGTLHWLKTSRYCKSPRFFNCNWVRADLQQCQYKLYLLSTLKTASPEPKCCTSTIK